MFSRILEHASLRHIYHVTELVQGVVGIRYGC